MICVTICYFFIYYFYYPPPPSLAWALFVLLLSTFVCCQPTLIWGLFVLHFPILLLAWQSSWALLFQSCIFSISPIHLHFTPPPHVLLSRLTTQSKAEREKLRLAHTLKQATEELESKRSLQAAHAARTGSDEFSV